MLNDQLKDFSIIAQQTEGKKNLKLKKLKFWAIKYQKVGLMVQKQKPQLRKRLTRIWQCKFVETPWTKSEKPIKTKL